VYTGPLKINNHDGGNFFNYHHINKLNSYTTFKIKQYFKSIVLV